MKKNYKKCPNRDCKSSTNSYLVVKIGHSKPLKCLNNKRRQRYLCKICNQKFSDNTGSLHYRSKKSDPSLNSKILALFVEGLSNRRIAKFVGISPHCVAIRIQRLSQKALQFHDHKTKHLKITEAVCIDGLENFAGSQFEPNNINQAIGQNSLFVYDFNFAPLNRKGRMSGWQKGWLKRTEKEQGIFNKNAIRTSFGDLVTRLGAKIDSKTTALAIITDEHFQYRRAVSKDLKDLNLRHLTISAKAHRDFKNILFPVNHMDLFIRERVAAFRRETIAFSKTPGKMMQKYILYAVYKNYMTQQFTKKQKLRPEVHQITPAQYLKICKKVLKFKDIFNNKSLDDRNWKPLSNTEWSDFYQAKVPDRYRRLIPS